MILKLLASLILAVGVGVSGCASAQETSPDHSSDRLSDEVVTGVIIGESQATYTHACPCPYDSKSDGDACGEGSAWSLSGGEEPLCYAEDVSDQMVEDWRAQN